MMLRLLLGEIMKYFLMFALLTLSVSALAQQGPDADTDGTEACSKPGVNNQELETETSTGTGTGTGTTVIEVKGNL